MIKVACHHLLTDSSHRLHPDLEPASWRLRVLIDGNNYVRAIQKANVDGSTRLYCAIDEGVVLRVAHGIDIVENLETALAKIEAQLGAAPQLVIALIVFCAVWRLYRTGSRTAWAPF